MDTETFGDRLKRLRLMRGLSQRKLAAASGLTNGAISQAESGDLWVGQLPSLDIVRRLARALDVSVDVLAGDDEMPVPRLSDAELMLRFGAIVVPEEEAEPTTFKLRVSGNCLAGTVEDGEVVWFDTTLVREPVCLVFAVKDDHEGHIKRLVERDGSWRLESDDGWSVPVDEHWWLVARAFTAQRRLL